MQLTQHIQYFLVYVSQSLIELRTHNERVQLIDDTFRGFRALLCLKELSFEPRINSQSHFH